MSDSDVVTRPINHPLCHTTSGKCHQAGDRVDSSHQLYVDKIVSGPVPQLTGSGAHLGQVGRATANDDGSSRVRAVSRTGSKESHQMKAQSRDKAALGVDVAPRSFRKGKMSEIVVRRFVV